MNEIEETYRGYFMGHSYLSPIQHGIQAAHVMQEMHSKFLFSSTKTSHIFNSWIGRDKTIILLRGGNSIRMREMYSKVLEISDKQLPVACFREDNDSMEGLMTSWGVVLPCDERFKDIYEDASPYCSKYEQIARQIHAILRELKTV